MSKARVLAQPVNINTQTLSVVTWRIRRQRHYRADSPTRLGAGTILPLFITGPDSLLTLLQRYYYVCIDYGIKWMLPSSPRLLAVFVSEIAA